MALFTKSLIATALLPLVACNTFSSHETSGMNEVATPVPLAGSTVIPNEMKNLDPSSAALSAKHAPILQVPSGILAMSEVIRPRAYLRQGPGTHFEVGDQLILKGTSVIILAEIGVWKKVQLIPEAKVGWIHHRALSSPHPNKNPVRIDAKNLPTVSTLRSLRFVESFPSHERIPMAVPRGSVFSFLRSNLEGYLVWLPVTNSVLWLKRKDAQ
jgi:hypothetical protein